MEIFLPISGVEIMAWKLILLADVYGPVVWSQQLHAV